MYREKATSRGGAAELITAVLHAALAQRHPDLGEHSDDVAGDVELLARTIGLDDETIEMIVKAGDLHDVGKLGIPDEIITKPGPLSEEEWEFMKQHTVMGEQIIAAAGPSLERIGAARARQPRALGRQGLSRRARGRGDPARRAHHHDLRLVPRDDRRRAPTSRRWPLEEALAELRRCAGSQFDPPLVEVFCGLVAGGLATEHLRGRAR